ncbi:MAG: hypothetical protein JST85_30035 [Acidobacteria bacterium]|nr:hypothetical protein [Acidobacteriota bacterium]
MIVAQWVVNLVMIYAAVGFLFALFFVIVGVGKIDPAAKESSAGFRFLILFGSAAFWPLLLKRWLRGQTHPPTETNDHRNLARRGIE